MRVRLFRCCTALVVLAAWSASGRAQEPAPASDLRDTLSRLAARVQQYYDRISTIICAETVTQQTLKFNRAPVGKPRVTVYELSVSHNENARGDREFQVDRTLQSVNGRRARTHEPPGCTDPKTGTPEPLGFLLAKNQRGFAFSRHLDASDGPAGTVALDFVESPPARAIVTWEGDCFKVDGGGVEGRLWFDPLTFDVLQVQERLPKPIVVPLSNGYGVASASIRVEQSEMLLRFTRTKFQQPEEEVLLPSSIEVVTVFRGVPSLKTTQTLGDFHRFLAETTVRPALK